MKRIFFQIAFFSVVIIIAFQSCDKIDPPFREEQNIDTTCTFTIQSGGAYRKVLAEEFTGHLCGSCPPSSIYLSDTLKPRYGDSLVVVAIHAGQFADVCPGATACPNPSSVPSGAFSTDFTTVAGNQWNSEFGISTNPVCMINRLGYPSSFMKPKSQWDNLIRAQLQTLATARIRIANTFDSSTRRLRTCIESKFLAYLNDSIKLQVVLTEDSIIDWQEWYYPPPEPTHYVPDYVFHHVLRTSVNSPDGTLLTAGNVSADSTIVNGFYYDIPSSWNADQCHVVVFLYKTNTKEVIQAEELKIK